MSSIFANPANQAPVQINTPSASFSDSPTAEGRGDAAAKSRDAQMEQRALWDAYVGAAEGKLKAAGVQFVAADKEAFYRATQPVRDKYGSKYVALLKQIQDTK